MNEIPITVNQFKWSPRCVCGKNDEEITDQLKVYRRLSNGVCAAVDDPQCIAEFQPSPGQLNSFNDNIYDY